MRQRNISKRYPRPRILPSLRPPHSTRKNKRTPTKYRKGNQMNEELLTGWKSICQYLCAGQTTIKKAVKTKLLPVKYPLGKPQLSKTDYLSWLQKQPPGPRL